MQAYTGALASALRAAPPGGAAPELAMEVATRLAERALREATAAVEGAGWGPCCDPPALLEHLRRMGAALGMSVTTNSVGEGGAP
jgi:hypothetical protein